MFLPVTPKQVDHELQRVYPTSILKSIHNGCKGILKRFTSLKTNVKIDSLQDTIGAGESRCLAIIWRVNLKQSK